MENTIKVDTISDAEADAEFGSDYQDDQSLSAVEKLDKKIASSVEGLPDFASLPEGFVIPPGKRCGWMKIRAEWTDAPELGDRWCMMWPVSEAEEKIAYKRSQGDQMKAMAELTKASIRVIDGVRVDRTGATGPGNVHMFWAQMGTKMRQMMQNYYLKTHTLSQEEQQDFFANCFVVTTAVAG